MSSYSGDSGDNSIHGSGSADSIDFSQGGEDTVHGGKGADTILAGAALDADDQIAGGPGEDVLMLAGDYSLVFKAATVTGIGTIVLGSGHDYDLTLADATVGSLDTGPLEISAGGLADGDHVRIDASAVQAGHDVSLLSNGANATLIGGAGSDTLSMVGSGRADFQGGAGDDYVGFVRALTSHDRLDGGDGANDQLEIVSGGTQTITGAMVRGFEHFIMQAGDYDLTITGGVIDDGGFAYISADTAHSVRFDASAEQNGQYSLLATQSADVFIGGGGDDIVQASGGDDTLTGNGGGDFMIGGPGADTFVYLAVTDSGWHKHFDQLSVDSDDHVDLSAIDAKTGRAGDQAFHLVASLGGHAGELAVAYDAGQNLTVVEGDVDGDGRADITIHLTGDQSGFTGWVL